MPKKTSEKNGSLPIEPLSAAAIKQQKRGGKTEYSGRRRTAKQKSGFQSAEDATGGKFSWFPAESYFVDGQRPLVLNFSLPESKEFFTGFGFYFTSSSPVIVEATGLRLNRKSLSEADYPNWRKCGAIFRDKGPAEVSITIRAQGETPVGVHIYDPICGVVWNEHFENQRDAVMQNISEFAPEALTILEDGEVEILGSEGTDELSIALKECNRCSRFLPVNLKNERQTLSFSNHCVSRAPCKHKGFGILQEVVLHHDSRRPTAVKDELTQLHFGFQLECRLCKKLFVNAALNPMRSADQMKEDGQRRRELEFLISELYQNSSQISFRHRTGKELTTFIWEKFDKKCFSCFQKLAKSSDMHLDHTRPLALLWPLDETASALCKGCNSSKRDRSPCDFYTEDKLVSLAEVTGIDLAELKKPAVNVQVLEDLLERLDWFYEDFLNRDFLLKEKDGKVSAELICKALDRAAALANYTLEVSFVEGYWARFA